MMVHNSESTHSTLTTEMTASLASGNVHNNSSNSSAYKKMMMPKRTCNAMEEFFADNNVRFGMLLLFDEDNVFVKKDANSKDDGEDKLPSLSTVLHACQTVLPMAAPLKLKRVDNSGNTVVDDDLGEEIEQENEWCIVCESNNDNDDNNNNPNEDLSVADKKHRTPLVTASVKVSMMNRQHDNSDSNNDISRFLDLRMSEQHSALPPIGPINVELLVSLPPLGSSNNTPQVKGILLDACHALYDGRGLINIATSILNHLNDSSSQSSNSSTLPRVLLTDTTLLIERSLTSIVKSNKDKKCNEYGAADDDDEEEGVPYLPPSHWTEECGSLLYITDLPKLILLQEMDFSFNAPLHHDIDRAVIYGVRQIVDSNNISMTGLMATLLLSSLYTTTMKDIVESPTQQIDKTAFLGISVLVDLRPPTSSNKKNSDSNHGNDKDETRRHSEGLVSVLPQESQLRIGSNSDNSDGGGEGNSSIDETGGDDDNSFLPQAFGTVTVYLPCQRFYDNGGYGSFVKPELFTLLEWAREMSAELRKRVSRGEAHRSSLAMFRNDGEYLLQDLPEATMELSNLGLLSINEGVQVHTEQHFDGYEGFRSMVHTEEGSGKMRIVSSVGIGLNKNVINQIISQFINWMEQLSAQVQ